MKIFAHNSTRLRGFTLLELLTVMTIVAMISTIGVASYFNMRTGGAYLSLSKNIQNMVLLARQQAALQNRNVVMLRSFRNEDGGLSEFILLFKGGVVTRTSGNNILNSFEEPPQEREVLDSAADDWVSSAYVYNLRTGKRHLLKAIDKDKGEIVEIGPTIYSAVSLYYKNAIRLELGSSDFHIGDSYGFLLHQPYRLPRGFSFDDLTSEGTKILHFTPNGEIISDGGGQETKFKIKENIRQAPIQVTIGRTGKVSVEAGFAN